MKNIISFLLVSIFIISLTACENTEEVKKEEVKNALEDLQKEMKNIDIDSTTVNIVIQ